MTVPLFEIKAKLSEYVTFAENGDVIEITKHGKTSAVIIGIDEYNQLKKNYRPSFIEQVKKWKEKTGGLEQNDFEAFEKNLERNKEKYSEESIF